MAEVYGILWDLDGVLADSGDLHYLGWQCAFKKHLDFSLERDFFFKKLFGMDSSLTIKTVLDSIHDNDISITPQLIQDIMNSKEEGFRIACIEGTVNPTPGIRMWLERIDSIENIQMIIASSAPQKNVDLLIDRLGFRQYFDHSKIVSTSFKGGLPGKPDPALFLAAAEILSIAPSKCLVIEDSPFGVIAAKSAGMKCLAIQTTCPSKEILIKSGPDLIVESMEQFTITQFNEIIGRS